MRYITGKGLHSAGGAPRIKPEACAAAGIGHELAGLEWAAATWLLALCCPFKPRQTDACMMLPLPQVLRLLAERGVPHEQQGGIVEVTLRQAVT